MVKICYKLSCLWHTIHLLVSFSGNLFNEKQDSLVSSSPWDNCLLSYSALSIKNYQSTGDIDKINFLTVLKVKDQKAICKAPEKLCQISTI